jgi:hypothetical protein
MCGRSKSESDNGGNVVMHVLGAVHEVRSVAYMHVCSRMHPCKYVYLCVRSKNEDSARVVTETARVVTNFLCGCAVVFTLVRTHVHSYMYTHIPDHTRIPG